MKIRGTYKKTVFRDNKSGYTKFSLYTKEKTEYKDRFNQVLCVGKIPKYKEGMPLCIEGEFEKKENLYILNINSYSEDVINEFAICEFLLGLDLGLSSLTAMKIGEVYKEDFFEKAKQPEFASDLMKKCNIKEKTAIKICDAVKSNLQEKELLDFIIKYGGTYHHVRKLIEKHGLNAMQALKEHPYITGREAGMSINMCDSIAYSVSGSSEGYMSPERMEALIADAVNVLANSGHTYVLQEQITSKVQMLSKTDTYEEMLAEPYISLSLTKNKSLFIEKASQNRIFSKRLRRAELNVAKQISRLENSSKKLDFNENMISMAEERCHMKYGAEQRNCFTLLERTGVRILTGGPGTGKTTTIKGILECYQEMYPENIIKLCAPTGRAAQRMKESTGMESTTIHRLLEYKPFGESVTFKNEEDPIVADLIVVDEMSMTDIELMSMLLSAIQDGTMLFLVGDINQLPSVGAGDVLNDLIKSEKLKVCALTQVFRQAADSPIVSNAYKINEGKTDLMLNDDFRIFKAEDSIDLQNTAIERAIHYFDPEKPFDMQILSPTHKGEAGTDAINKLLQEKLNPNKEGYRYGKHIYKIKDKIIMLNNNYAVGYFNGDIGIVTEILPNGVKVNIQDKEYNIEGEDVNDMDLAYAITIHKSQGSEFPNVIITLPLSPATMLKRNLLYTAVTRAKSKVETISEDNAISKSIYYSDTGKRNTRLKERLRALV